MIVRLLHGIFLLGLAASPMAAESGERDFVAFAPSRIVGAGDVIPIGTSAVGTVAEVRVKEGDRVTKGDVLVQIACRALQAEVRQRNAEAAAAEAVLARVKHGARDEEVAIAMAVVKVWEARAEEAERAHQRLLSLQQGIASRARLQEIERDSKTSAAQLLEARARLRMLQAGARGEDVIEAEARRAAVAAAVDQAQARLDECTVRAPIEGTVLMMNVTPGQFVKDPTALVPLLKMVDDRVLRVRAEIDEQDLQKICLGQRAQVTADAFKGVSLPAEVTQISPRIGSRTIPTGERGQRADGDIREVLLTLESKETRWPIGLRVLVSFLKC